MTIKVKVTHDNPGQVDRLIKVKTVDFGPGANSTHEELVATLRAGESTEAYIHSTRRLVLEEVPPE